MTYIKDFNTATHYEAVVKSTKRLTPENKDEIREIELEIEDADFDCDIDQSFGVLLNVENEFGNEKHHRLYSVSDIPEKKKGKTLIKFLVKRCSYIDDFNGEKYDGVSSNYLCDRKEGNHLTLTGPFELPFKVPSDKTANLILIGMGTGIAPFRAFIKYIYSNDEEWEGKVRLFYGANSGLELMYLNEKDGDLNQYYDKRTFEAIKALSPRPHWSDPIALDNAIKFRAEEINEMLKQSNTYVYVAGYEKVKEGLDQAFSEILGGKEKWLVRKAELIAGHKWAEIIY